MADFCDLDFLVQETMKGINLEAEVAAAVEAVENLDASATLMNIGPTIPSIQYPHTCGIVFYLQIYSGTFSIKAMATENIAATISQRDIGNEAVHYIETENSYLSDVLVEHVSKHRYPMEEEQIFSIGSPGLSWWLDKGSDQFEISFISPRKNGGEILMKLGPMTDHVVFGKLLNRYKKDLLKIFRLKDFFCDEKTLLVKANPIEMKRYENFLKIFIEGRYSRDSALNTTLNLYLSEVALLRRFWVEVERILEQERKTFIPYS